MTDASDPMPAPRTLGMAPELYAYALDHCRPATDPVSEALARSTAERFGGLAAMNIGPDQGRLLALLVRLGRARTVVEVGTFTGMSALWLARGLGPEGRLLCFDITDEFLPTAQEAWEAAGVADRISLTVGPAAETLAALDEDVVVDLAFIDADKVGYQTYLDLLLPRLAPEGLVVVDNVLWGGAVIDPEATDPDTEAIRAFNDGVAGRDDLEAVVLGVGDGITLIRRVDPAP